MNRADRVQGMPVFLGALRAKLILGVDDRVLVVVAIVCLMGMFVPLLFLLAGALFLIGRILGTISPYFFDELASYMSWRVFSWHGSCPDDCAAFGREPKSLKVFKRAKS